MIVFAAFTPHTPLVFSSVGQAQTKNVARTVLALDRLREDLCVARPDTVVVFSAHETRFQEAFCINVNDSYTTSLAEFGDHTTKRTFHPDLGFVDALQRLSRRSETPLTLVSDAELGYASAIPLLSVIDRSLQPAIVPITYSGLDPKTHLMFGRHVQEICQHSTKRIAIIASGDLSHALSDSAPAGLRPEGHTFDSTIQHAIASNTISPLLSLDPHIVERAAECGYRPLLMLLGAIEGRTHEAEILAYEAPYGVGYLTVHFHAHDTTV